jgi:hypothetical protein
MHGASHSPVLGIILGIIIDFDRLGSHLHIGKKYRSI